MAVVTSLSRHCGGKKFSYAIAAYFSFDGKGSRVYAKFVDANLKNSWFSLTSSLTFRWKTLI